MSELADFGELAAAAARRQKSAQGVVIEGLREAILRGMFREDQPLRQDVIAAQFGVSKIPVREALRQLEGEGLVTFYPRRGAVVARLTYERFLEAAEIRIALETLSLRLAMPNLTKDDLQRAEDILDLLNLANPGQDGVEDYGGLNWRFHETLYAPANRPRILSIIRAQHTIFQWYLRRHPSMMEHKGQGQSEHRQLLDLCKEGSTEDATRLIERHIRTVVENLSAHMS